MNKFILIVSICIVGCLAKNIPHHTSQLFQLNSLMPSETGPRPVSRQCLVIIEASLSSCNQSITTKWQHNPELMREIEDSVKSSDQTKMNTLLQKIKCCVFWESMDCMENDIQASCTSAEAKAMEQQMEVGKQNMANTCSEFSYHSSQCVLSVEQTPQLFDMKTLVDPTPVSRECISEMETSMTICNASLVNKWLNNPELKKEIDDATRSTDPDKLSKLMQRVQCCVGWEAMDCVDNEIKAKCSSAEARIMESQFDQSKALLTQSTCSAFPYHSSQCHIGTGPLSRYFEMKTLVEPTDISLECQKVMNSSLEYYTKTFGAKWQSNLQKEFDEANNNSDSAKLVEIATRLNCCVAWDVLDYIEIDALIDDKCTASDSEVLKLGFDVVKESLKEHCSAYPYHSTQCEIKV